MHSVIDSGFDENLQHGSCHTTQLKNQTSILTFLTVWKVPWQWYLGDRIRILGPLYPHLQCGYSMGTLQNPPTNAGDAGDAVPSLGQEGPLE